MCRTHLTCRRFNDGTRACSPTCASASFPIVVQYDDRVAFGSFDRFQHFCPVIRTFKRGVAYNVHVGPRCSRMRIRLCGPYTPNAHFKIATSLLPRALPRNVRNFRYRYRYRSDSCRLRRALRRVRRGFTS